jgi:extracellular factor (EF) 3-hydroxypalmitic acid methyl ester biosynthesis protein
MENKIGTASSPDSLVVCQNNSGQGIRAMLLHFTRFRAAFEIYAPSSILQMSEVLNDFKIILNDRVVYSGRAVVSHLVNAGEVLVCEVTLDDYWITMQPLSQNGGNKSHKGFGEFLQQWQKIYKVVPEFKVVVADMRSLLSDMRLWLGQTELSICSSANGNREQLEIEAAHELSVPILAAIDSLGDRFEEIASRLESDLRPVHIHFTRCNLHSLLLSSPFSYRTFHKPLGYAGDYVMVNMILRNPYEGPSLFAKVVNAWFLNQLPAQAHRNRIQFLKEKLAEEVLRVMRLKKRSARIFNLGCGPASEVQEFLSEGGLCDNAYFTLLDFNEETIQYTSRTLHDISKRFARKTPIQMQKKTVQQLLKEAIVLKKNVRAEGGRTDEKYDFIYCAGLFDYLTDNVCKQLLGIFYQWLAPDGLLLVTNVDGTRPFRNKLELILDWNLIYRTAQQLSHLKPDDAPEEICSVQSDLTSVNVFLEVRKPENA